MSSEIVVIDHKDSFTFNLVHLLEEFSNVTVKNYPTSYSELCLENIRMIVLSPGPGKPSDYPHSIELYKKLKGKIPILGVCLGFQMIAEAEGSQIIRQKKILHGAQTKMVCAEQSSLFRGIEDFRVARYHSLQIDPVNVPELITFTAKDCYDGVPLAFENQVSQIYGLQFHPESFLTPSGHEIIRNLLRLNSE